MTNRIRTHTEVEGVTFFPASAQLPTAQQFGQGVLAKGTSLYVSDGSSMVTAGGSSGGIDLNTLSGDKTSAIQDTINNNKNIQITGAGKHQISSTIIIPADREISIDSDVELFCKNTGNGTFNHFRNANFNAAINPVTSITPVATGLMYRVTLVTSAAMTSDLIAASYVMIKNDPSGMFNGVWKIETINPGTNTLTFLMASAAQIPRAVASTIAVSGFISGTTATIKTDFQHAVNRAFNNPSNRLVGAGISANTSFVAPLTGRGGSGTYTVNNSQTVGTAAAPITITVNTELQCCAADANIFLSGGILNSAFSQESFVARDSAVDTTAYNDCCIAFNNTRNLRVDNVTFLDVRKYRVLSANQHDIRISNIYGNSISDGVKIYGPGFGHIQVDGVYGTMGDDGVSLQTVDPIPTYAGFMPPNTGGCFYSGGQISNSKGRCNGYNGHSVLYPNGGKTTGVFDGLFMHGLYVINDSGSEISSLLNDTGVSGTAPGTAFAWDSGNTSGYIQSVVVNNPVGRIYGGAHNSGSTITNFDTLIINDHVNQWSGENAIIAFERSSFNMIEINGANVTNPSFSNNSNVYFSWRTSLSCKKLIFNKPILRNFSVVPSFSNGAFILIGQYPTSGATAAIDYIEINNPLFLNDNTYITNSSGVEFVSPPDIVVKDLLCLGNGNTFSIGGAGAANIFVNGARKASGSLFNFYGSGAITVNHSRLNLSQVPFVNAESGAATLVMREINPTSPPNRVVPTAGGTVSCNNRNSYNDIIVAPAGTLATLTLALPANPINGEVLDIKFTQAITALTITNGTLSGFTSGGAIAAGFTRKYRYSTADSLWI